MFCRLAIGVVLLASAHKPHKSSSKGAAPAPTFAPVASPSEPPPIDQNAEPGVHPLIAFGPKPVGAPEAEFGLLIDAGSTGSRLHVYEWPRRVFSTLPPPISHPLTSELWTKRFAPGISSFVDNPKEAAATLLPLIEHAKRLLRHYEKDWGRFPIWVKATAGMRALPHVPRRAIVDEIRLLLLRADQNPFLFTEADAARVISGEEEAGYAWTGINFALGHLLEDGTGSGTARPTQGAGIVEMGGASSQISFINPGHDIIENLFKVQVGGLKHWNIYARSFLHYGAYSAMQRMWNELADEQGCFAAGVNASSCIVHDACLPAGMPPMPIPTSVTNIKGVTPPTAFAPLVPAILMPAEELPGVPRYQRCFAQIVRQGSSLGLQGTGSSLSGYVEGATKRKFNEWCDWAHHGQCAMADVYLPLLPDPSEKYGNFHLLGSSLVDTFQLLGVPQRATLRNLSDAAERVCAMPIHKMLKFVRGKEAASGAPDSDDSFFPEAGMSEADKHAALRNLSDAELQQLADAAAADASEQAVREICFKAGLAVAMLNHGFGLEMDRELYATDVIETQAGNKLKAGWTLGAILFEINSLPWVYEPATPPECPTPTSLVNLQPLPTIRTRPEPPQQAGRADAADAGRGAEPSSARAPDAAARARLQLPASAAALVTVGGVFAVVLGLMATLSARFAKRTLAEGAAATDEALLAGGEYGEPPDGEPPARPREPAGGAARAASPSRALGEGAPYAHLLRERKAVHII